MSQNNKKSWERLPEETSKQYEAFSIYRDMGSERSISEVAKQWSKSGASSRLREWATKNYWNERSIAYDEHIDDIKRSGQEDEIREMAERHAKQSQLFQDKAMEKLKSLNIDDMKPQDIVKFYDMAVKIERLSRGVSTENIKREEVKEVKEDDITREKLQDPQVRKRATEFIRAIADSQTSTDRVGSDSQ